MKSFVLSVLNITFIINFVVVWVITVESTDDIDGYPAYFKRFLTFALAQDLALFKGRAAAWTDKLEQELVKATAFMESNSEVNLDIVGDEESLLNGSWRVRAGV